MIAHAPFIGWVYYMLIPPLPCLSEFIGIYRNLSETHDVIFCVLCPFGDPCCLEGCLCRKTIRPAVFGAPGLVEIADASVRSHIVISFHDPKQRQIVPDEHIGIPGTMHRKICRNQAHEVLRPGGWRLRTNQIRCSMCWRMVR